MEIRVLKYFLTIAREETILGASQVLHVTQPTLSRQMIDLENELGKKLFVRGNRRILLTEDGMFLRKRAQEIVDLAEKTEADFHSEDEAIQGDIYIGAGETDAFHLIARAVKNMQEKYPFAKYHIYSGNAEAVMERLDKGLLDFGIVIEPVDLRKYDYIKLPATDVWGLLIRRDHPLAERKSITAKDLDGIPLLCSRQTLDENELAKCLGTDVEKCNIIGTYNLIYNAAIMVEEGVGCALTLDKLVNTTGNSKLCFVPLKPRLHVSLGIIWNKYKVLCKTTEKFLEILQQEIQNLPNNFL